jgi:ferric-dicitrate binding protein FerR (iron transport regulator)
MQQEPYHIDWEQLIDLLEKPAAERQALVANLSGEEQTLFARLQQLKNDPLLTGALQLDTVQAWTRMMEKERAPVRRIAWGWKKWVAAASVLFIVGAGGWLWMKFRSVQPVQDYQTVAQALANHAPSGKVQLVTADGKSIELDSAVQVKEKDGTLIQLNKGAVAYQNDGNHSNTPGNALLMNTLIVPRGYLYNLVLSDGSKVWLNADSKISYPVHFDKAERKVTIEGEAYFEVTHNDKWPFVVSIAPAIGGGEVKVLGTSFDIKTYGKNIYTTLVTGSVLFTPPVANPVRLTPDQQTVFNVPGGVTKTRNVIAGDYIAWKDDDLVMIKMSLDELAAILERRYDVQISFAEERSKNIQYNGAFHFTGNIIEILNNLEQTGNIHFAVKNKTIVILPANGK